MLAGLRGQSPGGRDPLSAGPEPAFGWLYRRNRLSHQSGSVAGLASGLLNEI